MSNQTGNGIYYALLLILPLSALFARRMPLGRVAVMALAWVGIIATGLVTVALVNRNAWLVSGAHELFYGRDQSVAGNETRIQMAEDGHFYARAMINGVERRMLVDSGATTTALSDGTAAAAKLEVDTSLPEVIDTANGMVKAYPARVATLRVGGITASDLGVVVAPEFGETDVLGMNFLSKLKSWRVEGRMLVLTPQPT
ncbi:retropepsin-like aspartic protease family protein [Sphingomonas sp.]|jgi:aspartyl protease family protein|uniref:retropepsin-like aspartic protease family protein n=1 Tax=Sphingomonas sp. TaxID=28214 RepID=UPI002E2F4553|nr:TIGR02281 family clan AA aspartic protease [Sphingomonas sp.]HEX4693758.1 TIGR02281 family clan AA aspartic protease [Sphingomonas sp.]